MRVRGRGRVRVRVEVRVGVRVSLTLTLTLSLGHLECGLDGLAVTEREVEVTREADRGRVEEQCARADGNLVRVRVRVRVQVRARVRARVRVRVRRASSRPRGARPP